MAVRALLARIPSPQELRSFSNSLRKRISPSKSVSIVRDWPQTPDLDFCAAILGRCARIGIETEDFIRNLGRMRSLGLSTGTLMKVFEVLPGAFMRDGIDAGPGIQFLKKDAGITSQEEINQICRCYPEFLVLGTENRLRPLFVEISDLGFDPNDVKKLLIQNPRFLVGLEHGELSSCVNLLKGLNCRIHTKKKILANGLLHASVGVKIRIDLLCGHGLIRRDAFKILNVEPRSILYSLEDLETKIQFLLQRMGLSIYHLVELPDYLGVNLEKQIIHRLQVVELLKSKGALKMMVELKHFVSLSRRKFYNFFVKPYPECEKIFGGLVRDVSLNAQKMKPKHPPGLWKLFKSQKYSKSEEDVKNMKQFMEKLF